MEVSDGKNFLEKIIETIGSSTIKSKSLLENLRLSKRANSK